MNTDLLTYGAKYLQGLEYKVIRRDENLKCNCNFQTIFMTCLIGVLSLEILLESVAELLRAMHKLTFSFFDH